MNVISYLERELLRLQAKVEGAEQRRKEAELMADLYRGEADVIKSRIAELRTKFGGQGKRKKVNR